MKNDETELEHSELLPFRGNSLLHFQQTLKNLSKKFHFRFLEKVLLV
jgi:hypothetical protein